jgi:FtsZ-interacting cell division protein ZipA
MIVNLDSGEELYELLKVKRVADSAYRKVKFAHEGPKQPPKPKKEESKDEEEQKDKEESKDGGKENSTPQTDDSAKEATKSNEPEKEVKKENEPKKEWKQTATKKEFVSGFILWRCGCFDSVIFAFLTERCFLHVCHLNDQK